MRKPKSKKKVHVEDEETPPQYEVGGPSSPDLRLPRRLFAMDRFPTRRLNIYSSPDLLPFIRNVLRDTLEFETIRRSCFGNLFDLPARQCPVSCKLIHPFLTRQLVCLPKNTLWSAFGGYPFRYGLEEFGTVTGLPCGSYPERYKPNTGKAIVAGKDRVWKRLFGKKKVVTIADLCRMLETDKDMDGWKKIWIALIIIVDGVLIAHKQEARPTPRYVRMVENLKTESFLKTISCMKPLNFVPKKCEDPVATLVKTLKQRSFRLQGFPLSLQLVAFCAIPQLLDYIPAPLNNLTVMDLEDGTLPQHKSINAIHIRRVEFDPNLVVTPIIPIESQPQPGWGLFPDDAKDDSHGRVISEPIINKPKIQVKKKSATIKQSLQTRQPSARKQRRISSYFTRSTTQSFTNVQLTEMVIQFSTQMKQLKREMKRRKKRSHARLSSFNKPFSRRKQSNTPPHTPEPSHNQDQAPMETDDLPQKTSPIISQYEAQLHRDSADDPQASSLSPTTASTQRVSPFHLTTTTQVPTHPPTTKFTVVNSPPPPASDHCIHIQSVHVSPNHNNACVHTSPDHNYDRRQVSPVFNQTPPPSQMITHPNDATDDYDEPPRTLVSVQPPWDELSSVVYDKSDHPNSPEINHILYHGVRIYDPINPDPPIFDSSIPRSLLLLSPQPKTMLTSPTKSNDILSGFAVHATTVNAFTATASSNSPPSLPFKEANTHGVFDLTATKDVDSNVPSLEENHLANKLSKSPLIHALTLISPLPGLEWDLFYNIVSTKMDVWPDFAPCRKRSTFLWDERIFDIVLHQGKKWMEDVHTIYTPMLWNCKHWVDLAINLDMGYIEILDPLPALYADSRLPCDKRSHSLLIFSKPRLTMSSSSSASRSQTHTTRGIPSKYWCGSNLTTFGAQTKENLYRRFYRCEIAMKRQSEHHLFKWIDEAIIDEIRMVDKKVTHLQSDFQSFKRTTTMRLQEHGKKIDESLLEMKRIFHDQTILLEELRNKSTSVLDAKSHCPLLNVAAAAIALGTLAWLYAKMTSI
ncbi:hypothetical protein IGI04_019390 [Brassica rapa subsp. trilocularis]|uniref:GRF-type domain-containing protein n=1 Tax=Brassica rapa subsp. trilocularis TaxID=1813537 RepID=A0ABQ7MFP3_BRACM|nr:hypothetical protein IGI04_019390 [Brassica rapa subsp. trilocularis]